MPTLEPIDGTTYGGKLHLDDVEIGDILASKFKPHIKMKRFNGACDMSISYPTDRKGLVIFDSKTSKITFLESSDLNIETFSKDPDSLNPEGSMEMNLVLKKKPAKNIIKLKIESTTIDFQKILPLDKEFDQAACLDRFPKHTAPFVITPTSITDASGEVLKTRDERLCNSYRGRAKQNYHVKSELGEIKKGPNKGKQLAHTNVSRTTAHIRRGKMIDNDGVEAWVEDMNLDPDGTLTFTLPSDFLKTAKYPIRQAVGLDPAYTEDIDSWVTDTFSDSDSTWSDYDLFTEKGVPKGAVAEIIFAMQEAGVENEMGVRTDGSGLARYVDLHEAEGGGVQTARMFVTCHVDTGLIECWHSDVSDNDSFYLVGYWENVGFTERFDDETPSGAGSWQADETLVDSGAASLICHFLLRNQEADTANTMGVRDTSSSVERKVLVHEPETGGESILDMITKADASYQVDLYTSDIANTVITNAGYFGSEMDFVELFQAIDNLGDAGWGVLDWTPYLDEDGRVVDVLLYHDKISSTQYLGVRDGDDSSTERKLREHEAEDNGGSTGERTGFGMSAGTNASGQVQFLRLGTTDDGRIMGYFKPTAEEGVYELSVSDGIILGDTSLSQVVLISLASDGVKLGDTSIGVGTFPKTASDGIKLGDTPSLIKVFTDALTDGIILGDTSLSEAIFQSLASDGVKLGDSSIGNIVTALLASDGIKLGDTALSKAIFQALAADGVKLGDTSLSEVISGAIKRAWGIIFG